MWMYNGGWGWGGWLMMTVGMTLVFAVVITVIVVAVRYLTTGHSGHATPVAHAPEALLAERFARGEIDDEEYRRRVAVLREHSR